MQIHLALRRRGALLVYGIPIWYRIVSGLIAAALACAAIVSGGLGVMGNIIVLVSIVACLYEEKWTFDTASGDCAGRMGLVFAATGPRFAASDIARVRVEVFAKGRLDQSVLPPDDKMPIGSQARLLVELKSGLGSMIDSVPWKRKARLETSGMEIATALGVPFGD